MVFCCVPLCGSNSWKSDVSVTYHEFPSNPDLAAKWIKQINSGVKMGRKPMWFPRGKSVICSKHFVHTDFKDDSDTLKPRCVPTVFGHKYIGVQIGNVKPESPVLQSRNSPLIVKVNRPTSNETGLLISNVFSQAPGSSETENARRPETVSHVSPHSDITAGNNNSFLGALQYKNRALTGRLVESVKNIQPAVKPLSAPDVSFNFSSPEKSSLRSLSRKKNLRKEHSNELIEIGPNTFLKINPDIIKVNKKQTPSGNTVLQFLMDQKIASQCSDLIPRIVKCPPSTVSSQTLKETDVDDDAMTDSSLAINVTDNKSAEPSKENVVVQQVVGHLVDTHVCEESCKDLKAAELYDEEPMDEDVLVHTDNNLKDKRVPNAGLEPIPVSKQGALDRTSAAENSQSHKAEVNFLNKAPVLFTTNLPLSHCLTDKTKTTLLLKQKSRQIAALKQKITSMTKKMEELEDRCIVQERQLSYSFIKKLKNIRKNASKGEPCATYILEQIRCYTGSTKMRWSDTTLTQCAIWCRKAPYAYEYFKKADFFKLPCLGTVKRFMKKHPDVKFVGKKNPANQEESDSSSDFTFEDSDNEKEVNDNNSDAENIEPSSACEAILNIEETTEQMPTISNQVIENSTEISSIQQEDSKDSRPVENIPDSEKQVHLGSYPVNFGGSNLEVQEIILPSGEVVQCYASNVCDGTENGSQYYIIPNVDQVSGIEQEYNIVQTNQSLPVILQNLDSGQLPMQQDQLIFIANSTEQVECPETEVVTARV